MEDGHSAGCGAIRTATRRSRSSAEVLFRGHCKRQSLQETQKTTCLWTQSTWSLSIPKRSWNQLQALQTLHLCPSSLRSAVHCFVLCKQGPLLNLCPRQCGTMVQDAFDAHSGLRAPVAGITISEEWSAWQPPATDDRPETNRQKCPEQACEEQSLKLFEQWLPSNLKQNMVRRELVDCSGRDIDEKVWCIAIALGLHRNQLINPLFGLPVLDPKHSWSRCMLVALKHFVCFAKSKTVEMQIARRPQTGEGQRALGKIARQSFN